MHKLTKTFSTFIQQKLLYQSITTRHVKYKPQSSGEQIRLYCNQPLLSQKHSSLEMFVIFWETYLKIAK